MAIYASQYKDQPAITLESDLISAQFLPSIGSKLSSLVYKPRQRELMVQNPSEKYLIQPYDGHYESAECSGTTKNPITSAPYSFQTTTSNSNSESTPLENTAFTPE